MPKYPLTRAAWVLFVLGLLTLIVSLLFQYQMWQAVLGLRPVAPGGGEYMVALFIGLPCLLLSALLLGIATARSVWRSKASAIALVLALTVVAFWLALFMRSLFV